MAAALVQSTSGGQNTQIGTATATLTSAATAGNLLVATFGTDAYATTGAPTGWTESTGCRQETFLGHYVWWTVAAGGETSVSKALTVNATFAWTIEEWSGLTGTPFDISAGQLAQSSSSTYTTPSLVPSAGDRLLLAAQGGSHGTTPFTDLTTWLNGFARVAVGLADITGAHDVIGIGSNAVTADGVTSYSSGATYAPSSAESRTSSILAFKVAGAAPAATGPIYQTSQYGSFH